VFVSELFNGHWSVNGPECPLARNSRLLVQLHGNCEDRVVLLKLREYEDHQRRQNVDGGGQV